MLLLQNRAYGVPRLLDFLAGGVKRLPSGLTRIHVVAQWRCVGSCRNTIDITASPRRGRALMASRVQREAIKVEGTNSHLPKRLSKKGALCDFALLTLWLRSLAQ